MVCRHGCFEHMVVDSKLENKKHVAKFAKQYSIKRIQVSVYYSQANGIVEREHNLIIEALACITDSSKGNWVTNLLVVLLVDCTIVHQPIGRTLFFVVYSREVVLLVEMRHPT